MSSKGNDILVKARSHFRAARTVESLRKIEVPEWGSEVHYWSEMDVAERRAIWSAFRPGELPTTGELMDAAVLQVLLRSRDAFGERLFADADDEALRDTSPDVLMRIANEMGWRSTTLEAAEKN
jgi:hypothetical protein